MTKGKVVLLVEPSGSEMLFALVCSLSLVFLFIPGHHTSLQAAAFMQLLGAPCLAHLKSAPVGREVWFTGLTLDSLARQRAHPYEVRIT